MTKRNKHFTAEFKQDAVNYYHTSGKSLVDASGDLKIGQSTLAKWVADAKKNHGVVQHRGSGNYGSDAEWEQWQLEHSLVRKSLLLLLEKKYWLLLE